MPEKGPPMGPVGELEEDMPPPVFVLFVDEDGSNLSNCCMETLPFTCRLFVSVFSIIINPHH